MEKNPNKIEKLVRRDTENLQYRLQRAGDTTPSSGKRYTMTPRKNGLPG